MVNTKSTTLQTNIVLSARLIAIEQRLASTIMGTMKTQEVETVGIMDKAEEIAETEMKIEDVVVKEEDAVDIEIRTVMEERAELIKIIKKMLGAVRIENSEANDITQITFTLRKISLK